MRTRTDHPGLAILLLGCVTCGAPADNSLHDTISTTGETASSSLETSSAPTSAGGSETSDASFDTSDATSGTTGGSPAELECNGTPVSQPEFDAPYAFAAAGRVVGNADVNADDKLDVVLLDRGVSASVVLGSETGRWADVVVMPDADYLALELFDEHGDGATSFVAATNSPYRVLVLGGNGDGSFSMSSEFDLGEAPATGIAAVDIDGDDDEDIFVAMDSEPMILLNDGGLSAPVSIPIVGPAPLATGDLAIGDLDGLPGDDVLMHGARLFAYSRSAGVAEVDRLVGTMGGLAAVAQLDGSPFADLILAQATDFPTGYSGLSLALSHPSGFMAPASLLDACEGCVRDKPTTADVNDDSTVDVIYPSLDGVGILLGCGDGTFVGPVTVPFERALLRVLAVDVDDDGRLDLVTSTQGGAPELMVARGSG